MDDIGKMDGMQGTQGGGQHDQLKEAVKRIDLSTAKAEVDRMVAEGKVDRATVDTIYRGVKSMF